MKTGRPDTMRKGGVPMDDLADVVYEGLRDIKADIGDTENEDLAVDDSLFGTKTVMIHRTHEIMCRGLAPEDQPGFQGVEKQCWNVFRRNAVEAVDLGIADAMLMACGRMLAHEDLAVLPHSKESAQEMVDVHFDLSDESADSLTRERLARKLYNFTQGYLNGPLAFEDELAVRREANREVERERKSTYRRSAGKPPHKRRLSNDPTLVRERERAATRRAKEEAEAVISTGVPILDKLAVDRFRRSREVERKGFVAR